MRLLSDSGVLIAKRYMLIDRHLFAHLGLMVEAALPFPVGLLHLLLVDYPSH